MTNPQPSNQPNRPSNRPDDFTPDVRPNPEIHWGQQHAPAPEIRYQPPYPYPHPQPPAGPYPGYSQNYGPRPRSGVVKWLLVIGLAAAAIFFFRHQIIDFFADQKPDRDRSEFALDGLADTLDSIQDAKILAIVASEIADGIEDDDGVIASTNDLGEFAKWTNRYRGEKIATDEFIKVTQSELDDAIDFDPPHPLSKDDRKKAIKFYRAVAAELER